MIAVTSHKGTNNRKLVRQRRLFREAASQCDARNLRVQFTGRTLNSRRRSHLRVKCFRLTGTAMQKQKDNGLVFQQRRAGIRVSLTVQQVR